MKKLLILSICFLIALVGILLIPTLSDYDAVDIQTVTPNIIDYELKSTATGTIKKSDEINIELEFDVVIDKFNKSVGDTVKKGDLLFTIDKEKTIELLSSIYSTEEIALYQDYIDSYPLEYRSEYNGIVTNVNDSSTVYAGNPIIEMSTGSGYIASVFVTEKDIFNISLGQNAEISGDAFGDKTYKGRIVSIADTAAEHTIGNKKETSVNVIIEILNPDNALKAGYNVTAEIIYAKIEDAVTIPYESLREDDDSYYVYKLYNNSFVYKSRVDLLYEDKDFVVVNGKINENSEICITNKAISDKIVYVNVVNEGIKY